MKSRVSSSWVPERVGGSLGSQPKRQVWGEPDPPREI